jgi:hypothetical protein
MNKRFFRRGLSLFGFVFLVGLVFSLVSFTQQRCDSRPPRAQAPAALSSDACFEMLLQARSFEVAYKTLSNDARVIVSGNHVGEIISHTPLLGADEYYFWAGKSNQGILLCSVKTKTFSWTTTAFLYDNEGALLAKIVAKSSFLSSGAQFMVYDRKGALIGHSKSVEPMLSKFRLRVYDSDDSEVAFIEPTSTVQLSTKMIVSLSKHHDDPKWKRIILAILVLDQEEREKKNDDD